MFKDAIKCQGQPERGNRGCSRFITSWRQLVIFEERYYIGPKLRVGTRGETYSGFMDDYGNWHPFPNWPLLA